MILESLGDCYESAVRFVMRRCMTSEVCPYNIVHAEVSGQGDIEGVRFGHAYVIDTRKNIVIDNSNGRRIRMPRAAYEALGQIREINNFVEYTWNDARNKLIEHEHYGPWELKTSTGL